ncbi:MULTISPECIES: SMP-30/gluconolactonase/LRE family protein [unclassified Pseudomonas]|uniref:SMP-30/gluconolactonase/LRE family protein n=1 Tax=unclassified Pseudomonas TaxID=196821 RepID=UPI000BC3C93D|nr:MULTISPECIES: SMP-30/gluconolactonase/LRE family protein [unclassified Pseudomonas]PVZ20534.1 gluconolactonase [Pseudomonas sp. URIL14HWK12:I12]PVZ27600.1 gluconolactonase [Pseudomonas sp. URIL14HWK12:I10]PVZ38489.1 gluconolactonase [Pseudomonas sp. URIL14HWK12:I11]SNZ03153.1 gluconolactonase [Pseudomonas sp. URIL14HWK12:I9]
MSFFAAPPTVEATVFTRLPDAFRTPRRNAWGDANRQGRPIDSFLEGPSFDRQGRLYVTDIPYGRIFRISADGQWELVCQYDGWPNGLKIHQDGRIFITDYKRGIVLLDPETGRTEPYLESAGSEGFKGVNDLVFAPNGDMYFTDQGQTGQQDATGRVYKLSADGQLTCLINTVPSPNGIVYDPHLNHLLIAVTRAQQIWRIPLGNSSIISKVGVFSQLHGGLGGPDGLALDNQSNLYIAHTGFGSVWCLSKVGEPLLRIKSCCGISNTNLAFGGADGQTLYIVESETGTIMQARGLAPGLPMYSHS